MGGNHAGKPCGIRLFARAPVDCPHTHVHSWCGTCTCPITWTPQSQPWRVLQRKWAVNASPREQTSVAHCAHAVCTAGLRGLTLVHAKPNVPSIVRTAGWAMHLQASLLRTGRIAGGGDLPLFFMSSIFFFLH